MWRRLIVNRHYKLQYERVRQSYVLMYPEGVVTLNNSASEILKLCDGSRDLGGLRMMLAQSYDATDVDRHLDGFVRQALNNRWVEYTPDSKGTATKELSSSSGKNCPS